MMGSSARTSAVVVHWNTPDLLKRCLEALRESREQQRVEVFVIDNGSRDDGFPDIVEAPGLRVVRNPGNHGFARAANQGAVMARGERLLFVNADAVVSGSDLVQLESALDADPGLAAVAPCALSADGELHSPAMRFLNPLNHAAGLLGLDRPALLARSYQAPGPQVFDADWVSASVLLLRTAAFEDLCGFDESYFFYGEDEDLCWRLRRRGYRVAVHGGVRVGDARGASSRQVPEWSERELYRGQLRFMRRRAGALGVFVYRVAVSTAVVIKLVARVLPGHRPASAEGGAMAVLRCLWGRQRLSIAQD